MPYKKDRAIVLGMPFGTAQQRLRKKILFHLVQKCGLDICFKCGGIIELIEELSIEHKIPWEGKSEELFWSLDNIAFSHLKCNRPHVYHGWSHLKGVPKKNTVGGHKWCPKCKTYLLIENFTKHRSKPLGLEDCCKNCRKIYTRRK